MRILARVALVVLLCGIAAPVARADWDYANIATGSAVDGYASEVSVQPGQKLHFHVSTSPPQIYRIYIYRLGPWSGRLPSLAACAPSCSRTSHGRARPTPKPDPSTGEVRAGWPVTDTFRVPPSWRSGYYVAKAVLVKGPQHDAGKFIPFVVRARPGTKSTILVVAPVNTWQAYNRWGGTGLYTGPPHAVKASFDRPYGNFGIGGQSVFEWDLPLARFLESQGYDISYTTDVDVDRDPGSVLGHKLVVVSGHSEYWTGAERGAFDAARDAGVNLFFAGANDGYWQIRYEDGSRTIVGYKGQSDPPYGGDPLAGTAAETTYFRLLNPPRPECQLIGIASQNGLTSGPPGFTRFVVDGALGYPWFAGTGFTPGASIPSAVGYEWDRVIPGCSPPLAPGTSLITLFHADASATNGTSPNDSVTYTAPSGARVFSAGSFQFSWGLDGYGLNANHGRQPPDDRLRKFTRNMLRDLAGPPVGALQRVTVPKSASATKAIPIKAFTRIPDAIVRVAILASSGTSGPVLASKSQRAGPDGAVAVKLHLGRRARGRRTAFVNVAIVQPSDAAQTFQQKLTLKR